MTGGHRAHFIVILALAAALRVAWSTQVTSEAFLRIDGRDYLEIAQHLASGRGHTITSPRWFEPASLLPPGPRAECHRPPLLPWIGAALFVLPGPWEIWARAVMLLFGVASVALLRLLGSRLGEPRAGLIAAAIFAVHPYAIFYAGAWSTETPFLLLVLGAVTALAPKPRSTRSVALAGLFAALAALARPTGLLLLPILAGWITLCARRRDSSKRIRRPAAIFLAVAVVSLLPWTLRNLAVTGVPNPGTSFGPYNRWLGHNDRALALYHTTGTPDFAEALRGLYDDSKEIVRDFEQRGLSDLRAMNREWDRRTRDWVVRHPMQALELWGRRALHYFRAAPEESQVSPAIRWSAILFTWPVHLLALAAIWRRRRDLPWLLLLPPLTGLAASLPFIFHLRFRHPFLDPYAVLLAGLALSGAVELYRQRSSRSRSVASTIRSTE